jgi:hypothetical protein
MYSTLYESKLSNIFSEIFYVDSNPYVQIIRQTYKQDGQLKLKSIKEEIKLDSLTLDKSSTNILTPECNNSGIIDKVSECCESIYVDFYPKNILQRIFRDKTKNILIELEGKDYDYLITNDKVYSKIKDHIKTPIFIENNINNKVILGRRGKLYLSRELKEVENKFQLDFYFNKEQFTNIVLC